MRLQVRRLALKRAAVTIASVLLASASNAATKPKIMSFCLIDAVQAATGEGETFPLGSFTMKARLNVSGNHYVLDAWNVMPDNPQVLAFTADGTYQKNGPTKFRFIDGWDNRGRGAFTVTRSEMMIEMERVSVAEGGENIGRNYGSYKLSTRGCKWTSGN